MRLTFAALSLAFMVSPVVAEEPGDFEGVPAPGGLRGAGEFVVGVDDCQPGAYDVDAGADRVGGQRAVQVSVCGEATPAHPGLGQVQGRRADPGEDA